MIGNSVSAGPAPSSELTTSCHRRPQFL